MIGTRLLCGVMLLTCLAASSGQRVPVPQHEEPPLPPDQARAIEKARQEQRYKDMKRDTAKLLELATELNQEVERSGEQTLSLNAIKKAEQIEKLAHSVKTRMRGD